MMRPEVNLPGFRANLSIFGVLRANLSIFGELRANLLTFEVEVTVPPEWERARNHGKGSYRSTSLI